MNTRSLSTLLCASMSILLATGSTHAALGMSSRVQSIVTTATVKSGSLTVAVRTVTGEAGSGLIVELLKNRGEVPPIHAKSNALGVAHFNNLPADSYLVLIYSPEGELLAWQMATVTPNTNSTTVIAPMLP